MQTKKVTFIIPILLVIFFGGYYYLPNSIPELDKIFISIMIFLFATLTGFFISRQGNRYNTIIARVTDFDGWMSALYRDFGLFGIEEQQKFATIAKEHYQKIISSNSWDSYFASKTNTLSSTYGLISDIAANQKLDNLRSAATARVLVSLESMQKIRKNLIALYKERIPSFQWSLIIFLVLILITVITSIPSFQNIFISLLKASFSTAIIAVVIMLWKLNNLSFFESMVGKSSGQDVLDIIEGKK